MHPILNGSSAFLQKLPHMLKGMSDFLDVLAENKCWSCSSWCCLLVTGYNDKRSLKVTLKSCNENDPYRNTTGMSGALQKAAREAKPCLFQVSQKDQATHTLLQFFSFNKWCSTSRNMQSSMIVFPRQEAWRPNPAHSFQTAPTSENYLLQ